MLPSSARSQAIDEMLILSQRLAGAAADNAVTDPRRSGTLAVKLIPQDSPLLTTAHIIGQQPPTVQSLAS